MDGGFPHGSLGVFALTAMFWQPGGDVQPSPAGNYLLLLINWSINRSIPIGIIP